jgi:hypothetical protein
MNSVLSYFNLYYSDSLYRYYCKRTCTFDCNGTPMETSTGSYSLSKIENVKPRYFLVSAEVFIVPTSDTRQQFA